MNNKRPSPLAQDTKVLLLLVVITLLILICTLHVPQYASLRFDDSYDLSGGWQGCKLNKPAAFNVSIGKDTCTWREVMFPGTTTSSIDANGAQSIALRKMARLPLHCGQTDMQCSFVIGGFHEYAEVKIDGTSLGVQSFPVAVFPAIFNIPKEIAARNSDDREFIITIWSTFGVVGQTESPIGIIQSKDSFRVMLSLIIGRVMLPLLSAASLLTFALLAILCLTIPHVPKVFIRKFIIFAVTAAASEISLSRLPRALFDGPLPFALHFLLRFAMDLSIINLAIEMFAGRRNRWLNILRMAISIAAGYYLLLALIIVFSPNLAFHAVSNRDLVRDLKDGKTLLHNLIFVSACFGLMVSFFGYIFIAVKSFLIRHYFREWGLITFTFSAVVLMSAFDLAAFWGIIFKTREIYFARLYPVLIALGVGYVLWIRLLRSVLNIEASARIGSWSVRLVHDIRSPLAALRLLATGMKKLGSSEQEIIGAVVSKINHISDELLTSAKKEFEDSLGQPGMVVLHALLQDISNECSCEDSSESGLVINLSNLDLETKVRARDADLKRVLVNVINNSREAMLWKSIISITAKENRGSAVIVINDNGPGISSEVLMKIMEPGVTSGKAEGYGFGLYSAKILIESWGGDITVDSMEGSGTQVTIRLKKVN